MDDYKGTVSVIARPALQGLVGCACGVRSVSTASEEEKK